MVAELASVAPDGSGQQVGYIPIERIRNTTPQVRRDWRHDEGNERLDELVQSIRNHGILQPIEVTMDDDGYFQVVVGHRRFVAGKRAGLTHLPCVVRDVNEPERTVLQLAENIHRQELSAVDEADAYAQLLRARGSTVAHVARTLAVSERRINIWLRMGARTVLREAVAAGLIAPLTAATLGELDDEAAAPLYARLRQGERIGPCDVSDARHAWWQSKAPALHGQGQSIEAIARELGLGQKVVARIVREAEAPTSDPPNVTFNGVSLDPIIAKAQERGEVEHEAQPQATDVPAPHPRPMRSPLPWENHDELRVRYDVDPAGLVHPEPYPQHEAPPPPAPPAASAALPPERLQRVPVSPLAVDDPDVTRLRFMLQGAQQPCRDLLGAMLNLGREKGWTCHELWRKLDQASRAL